MNFLNYPIINYDRHKQREFGNYPTTVDIIQNLGKFLVSTKVSSKVVNASRWKSLISSAFIHLKVFKFHVFIKFDIYDQRYGIKKEIFHRFEQFINEFWCKEHQWHTVHISYDDDVIISTIPYSSKQISIETKYKYLLQYLDQ